MSEPTRTTPEMAKRRQYLLLGGIVSLIAGGALLAVTLGTTRESEQRTAKLKSTPILAPGAQVDPRDAWRGQADAHLKSIEQKSKEASQRSSELEQQNKSMLERLKKLEQSGLTPLPPPPVAVPALRPSFGPDQPAQTPDPSFGPDQPAQTPDTTAAQRLPLPPLPPVPPLRSSASATATALASPSGIISITLADPAIAKSAKGSETGKTNNTSQRDTRRYLPSGTFTRAVLLGGLDAPTGGQAQRNPQPVLLRLADNAILPNHFRARVKECFVVGAGYGDVSSERAYIRTESLSCVTRDGTAIDIPVKGYVAGEDGKAGMRGRLVSKQGQILANALVAGIASGIGHAFQQGSTTLSVSPLGSTSSIDSGKQLEAGIGAGVGKALDRLAQYYISLAEKVFPVIEIDAGRTVDVVLTTGVSLQGALDETSHERDAFPRLTERNPLNKRKDDDEDQ